MEKLDSGKAPEGGKRAEGAEASEGGAQAGSDQLERKTKKGSATEAHQHCTQGARAGGAPAKGMYHHVQQ